MPLSPTKITVETVVNASRAKVWDAFTLPEHIVHWNFASPDWHAPRATNDLRVGGKFLWCMEARDGSTGFDFEGEYTQIKPLELIEYTIPDGRKVRLEFSETPAGTKVIETFDAETQNSESLQRAGWQSILDNFKKYIEKGAA